MKFKIHAGGSKNGPISRTPRIFPCSQVPFCRIGYSPPPPSRPAQHSFPLFPARARPESRTATSPAQAFGRNRIRTKEKERIFVILNKSRIFAEILKRRHGKQDTAGSSEVLFRLYIGGRLLFFCYAGLSFN